MGRKSHGSVWRIQCEKTLTYKPEAVKIVDKERRNESMIQSKEASTGPHDDQTGLTKDKLTKTGRKKKI